MTVKRTKQFFVSVIIPVYNGEAYLAEAVESIMRQNHEPLEIIIVDDGSTDNTAKIAAGLQGNVHYVHQLNSGPAAARNRGLKIARGDMIGFLDVDDLWQENKLNVQIGHFEKNPSVKIVLGYLQRMQMVSDGADAHLFKEWDQPVMNMHLGSGLFRKSVFDKVGCLDESLDYCEDWDWFMKAKEMNVPIMVHKEVTYYYRRHDNNITNDMETNSGFALKMLRQSLNRRRKHQGGKAEELPKLSDYEEKPDGKEKTGLMTEPLVSVIIPVYNGEKYLAEAIESVLAQTFRPIEIIVVDDGSTDGSADIAKGFSDHVHYLYQSNHGCPAARNTGIKNARGSFFAFLDADDLWTEDKLGRQIAVMEADPGLQIVFGHVSHFYSPDIDAVTKQKVQCPTEKMPGYHHGAILVTRNAFLDIGLFSEQWECGEFLDWSFRAKEKGYRSVMMPEVVMKRRIHSSNRGILVREIQPDYVRVLKAALDRRRNKCD